MIPIPLQQLLFQEQPQYVQLLPSILCPVVIQQHHFQPTSCLMIKRVFGRNTSFIRSDNSEIYILHWLIGRSLDIEVHFEQSLRNELSREHLKS